MIQQFQFVSKGPWKRASTSTFTSVAELRSPLYNVVLPPAQGDCAKVKMTAGSFRVWGAIYLIHLCNLRSRGAGRRDYVIAVGSRDQRLASV